MTRKEWFVEGHILDGGDALFANELVTRSISKNGKRWGNSWQIWLTSSVFLAGAEVSGDGGSSLGHSGLLKRRLYCTAAARPGCNRK